MDRAERQGPVIIGDANTVPSKELFVVHLVRQLELASHVHELTTPALSWIHVVHSAATPSARGRRQDPGRVDGASAQIAPRR
jgi:hypothetical protein